MSKHDVISETLTTLTRTKTFARAVKGWSVRRLIHLTSGPGQSCELCGTRFWKGAVVTRVSPRITIVVGGTCLTTLQRHRFPPSFDFKHARHQTWNMLKNRYGDV